MKWKEEFEEKISPLIRERPQTLCDAEENINIVINFIEQKLEQQKKEQTSKYWERGRNRGRDEMKKEMLDELIRLTEICEGQTDTSFDEWKGFKCLRNSMRDIYDINIINIK